MNCTGWPHEAPQGVQCPPALTYPLPPSPVDILFVGWNPPGRCHFWNCSTDRLRLNLEWVLGQLDWSMQPNFLSAFFSHRCYFVHAVKCWPHPDWPPTAVTKTCAKALLGKDIQRLRPKTLCLLGHIPHLAASAVMSGLPSKVQYGKGWCSVVEEIKVIITAFPNKRWNPTEKKANRECTLATLSQYL